MKILVKFPSRSRPERFFRSLDSLYQLCYAPENMYVLLTADTDDGTMMNSDVYTRIVNDYKNIKIVYGRSEGKVHAINRDMDKLHEYWPEAADWDAIVVLSDDIRMIISGWDEIIRMEFQQRPTIGGTYLHFMEKDTKRLLNVMEIMNREYYDRFGYIYHPSYKSLWCDNEKTEVAKMLKCYHYIDSEIFVHENPVYGYQPRDAMFDAQQALWGVDEENYRARKAINFEIDKLKPIQ